MITLLSKIPSDLWGASAYIFSKYGPLFYFGAKNTLIIALSGTIIGLIIGLGIGIFATIGGLLKAILKKPHGGGAMKALGVVIVFVAGCLASYAYSNPISAAENARFREAVKPVVDKYSKQYNEALAKEMFDQIAKIRGGK